MVSTCKLAAQLTMPPPPKVVPAAKAILPSSEVNVIPASNISSRAWSSGSGS